MDLETVADELYGLRPEEFTAVRGRRAAAARKAGERSLAERIAALRRPTLAAWSCNLLVRGRPGQVRPLIRLGEALRQAHRGMDGQRAPRAVAAAARPDQRPGPAGRAAHRRGGPRDRRGHPARGRADPARRAGRRARLRRHGPRAASPGRSTPRPASTPSSRASVPARNPRTAPEEEPPAEAGDPGHRGRRAAAAEARPRPAGRRGRGPRDPAGPCRRGGGRRPGRGGRGPGAGGRAAPRRAGGGTRERGGAAP
ncbi:hypothetical protein SALBM135S_10142 [Streptomyces alboniger]